MLTVTHSYMEKTNAGYGDESGQGHIFSVSFWTTLKLLKNSLAKTLITVYVGMATIIPTIPARLPAIMITMKILYVVRL